MKTSPDRTSLDRLEQLATDAVTVGLTRQEAAELQRLEEELGPEGQALREEIERVAAQVALASVDPPSAMPAHLRRRVQDQAFAHFDEAPRGSGAPPITTAGANVVELPPRRLDAPTGGSHRWMWAAAAAVFLVSGAALQRWRTTEMGPIGPTPAGPAASVATEVPKADLPVPAAQDPGELKSEASGLRLELRWRPGDPRGTLVVTRLNGFEMPARGRVVLEDPRDRSMAAFELTALSAADVEAMATGEAAREIDVPLPARGAAGLTLRFERRDSP